ncbi:MAG TPA: sodium-dependent transporter [Thermoanaerobaculia bacterium]|nr:sodium-dependent transporter [Thermoanaerobaculia bacterium]HUM31048.1 sodium-dependent transporter [Thermoanaerobaculia bacterium]HXK69346.1 sodium-dependent transporter [Thermoanaerobaculia bacterium]
MNPGARGNWGSKFAFVLAAAGSAVGLGNVWRFPVEVGRNGGAAYVIVYFLCVLLMGVPVMMAEFSLGRSTGKNVLGAFSSLAPRSLWRGVGLLGILTGMAILSYYSVVAGWTVGYFIKGALGQFSQMSDPEAITHMFVSFIGSPANAVGYHALFMVITMIVVAGGVEKGIERWCKFLMPTLFGLLILLVIRSVTLEGAGAGLSFYLHPDFSKLDAGVILSAMGQAFFSLSLGMGAMVTYGSYLSRDDNLFTSSIFVSLTDSLVAFLAGLAIFPALFAVPGLKPEAGPGLIFMVLPNIFNRIPLGQIFGAGFFLLLTIAAVTSSISLLEVVVAHFVDDRGWKRKPAVITMGIGAFILGVPSALSLGAYKPLGDIVGGKGFLDLFDLVFGHFSLTIGALLLCLFITFKWGMKAAKGELLQAAPGALKPWMAAVINRIWPILIRWVCPILIGAIILYLIFTPEAL